MRAPPVGKVLPVCVVYRVPAHCPIPPAAAIAATPNAATATTAINHSMSECFTPHKGGRTPRSPWYALTLDGVAKPASAGLPSINETTSSTSSVTVNSSRSVAEIVAPFTRRAAQPGNQPAPVGAVEQRNWKRSDLVRLCSRVSASNSSSKVP